MTPRWRRAVARAVLPLAFALVIALTGCDALGQLGGASHYPPATSFTVRSRVTTLVIDGGSGSVDVTGNGQSAVSVSQQASYSKTAPVVKRILRGTTLTLSYSCAVQLSCSVSYTVSVPRAVSVRVSASTGEITLTSLAGAATAQTSAGEITADNLSSPSVSLTSDAGGIVATCSAAPLSLRASTDIGAISLTVPDADAYKISTRTIVGTSTITVRRSAGSPHAITASSDLGSISISPA